VRVAEVHREHRAALPTTVMPQGPALTASDVKETLWNVENLPSGSPGAPGAVRSTYDVNFVDDQFQSDALP
jgi:hypothetical protein